MKWYIQDSTSFGSLDRNVKPLIEALEELSVPYHCMGIVPFSHVLTGMENQQVDNCIFYGSTLLIEKLYESKIYTPAVFYHPDWFDPRNWVGKRGDLLNEDVTTITCADLRTKWVDEPTFVKSIATKVLNGMVIEPDKKDKDDWLIEQSQIDKDELLAMSPIHNIEREWRFFIINGEVITGSLYKMHGRLRTNQPIPDYIWQAANRMSKDWMPSPNIVLDICELRDGTLKVVEGNCLNCSGGYASDWKKIIEAINNVH